MYSIVTVASIPLPTGAHYPFPLCGCICIHTTYNFSGFFYLPPPIQPAVVQATDRENPPHWEEHTPTHAWLPTHLLHHHTLKRPRASFSNPSTTGLLFTTISPPARLQGFQPPNPTIKGSSARMFGWIETGWGNSRIRSKTLPPKWCHNRTMVKPQQYNKPLIGQSWH